MKLVSDRLVDSSRKHTSGLQDISHDYNRNQDHRSDRTMSLSHHTHRHRQPTTHNRHRRRRATTQRRRGGCDRYYSPTDESDEYSQTEVDEPQVTHSSHEDRLDNNRRTPPRVPPIRQGINMDRQQDRRYFLGMYKSLKYTGKTSWKAFYTKFRGYARTAGWTEEQKKDQLLWSLEDKAGEYLTLLLERDPLITYPEIIEKVEKRFGFQDVPKMSMIQFQNCKQEKHESLEEWANRVLSLANKASRELPETSKLRRGFVRGVMTWKLDSTHVCKNRKQLSTH